MFPALGLKNSFIEVPQSRMPDYAQGYKKDGAPIRMAPGVLSAEAYGVKSSAADMTRFMQANMNLLQLDAKLQRAITETHTGYFKAGVLTQDLIWEQYAYPVALKTLLAGNSSTMVLKATPAIEIKPPLAPRQDVWINKTGSTNGFGAYVAFVPEKRLGIVMLANKNIPNEDRVAAAYGILTALAEGGALNRARLDHEQLALRAADRCGPHESAVGQCRRKGTRCQRDRGASTRPGSGKPIAKWAWVSANFHPMPPSRSTRQPDRRSPMCSKVKSRCRSRVDPRRVVHAGESYRMPANVVHVTTAGPAGAKVFATWAWVPGKPFNIRVRN